MLTKVSVKPEQCHFLPAGTAHAIGGGLLIAEIQTPSDTTYRVFDWNRVDQNAKPRQLHIEEALESIHFDQSDDELSVTTVGRLADCDYFKIDKGHMAKNTELLLSAGKIKTLVILSGSGKIIHEDISVDFTAGDTILIPFDYKGAILFAEETQYLTITI